MQKLLDILNQIVEAYSWAGIALIGLTIMLFITQIVRYSRYNRIWTYRLTNRPKTYTFQPLYDIAPPMSVIVPLMSEDMDWVENTLPVLMSQKEMPMRSNKSPLPLRYEVVVVYVGNDENFFADLRALSNHYTHLRPIQIGHSSRYPVSAKQALNVGIKSATNEHIVITSTEATPTSDLWLCTFGLGFCHGDIVIGHSSMPYAPTLTNRLLRRLRFTEAVQSLCRAVEGRAYAASRHNFGFTRTLYFSHRGFNYLNMNTGEGDLFLQSILCDDNASVVLTPRTRCQERPPRGIRHYLTLLRSERATHRYYPAAIHNYIDSEPLLRACFFLCALVTLCVMPVEIKVLAATLLLVRYVYVSRTLSRIAVRLGDRRLGLWSPLYDMMEPLIRWVMRPKQPKHSEGWR